MTPPWLLTAFGEIGVDEIPGREAEPRIVQYAATTTLAATSDEVPWCSSFVNWCLTTAGLTGTNSAAARSWLRWGLPTAARLGAVAVFRRGEPPQGHVGFFVHAVGNQLVILSGNVGNQVQLATFPEARLLGYRWPV